MKKAARVLFSALLAVIITACATPNENLSISKLSTPELKLRHAQILEEIKLNPPPLYPGEPLPSRLARNSRIEHKAAIERELLHRYTTGDKEAHLRIFDSQ